MKVGASLRNVSSNRNSHLRYVLWLHSLWDNHELLEGEATASVRSAVENVLEGDRQNIGLLGTGEVRDVSIQGNTLLGSTSLGDGQANTEDGIGTQVDLVGGSVKLDEELVNLALILNVDILLNYGRSDSLVDILNGLQDTLKVAEKSGVLASLYGFRSIVSSPFPPHFDLSPSRNS